MLAETEGTAATQRSGAVTVVHFGSRTKKNHESRITTQSRVTTHDSPCKIFFQKKQKTTSISDFLGFLDFRISKKKLLQLALQVRKGRGIMESQLRACPPRKVLKLP
jgi:hypothetical protein